MHVQNRTSDPTERQPQSSAQSAGKTDHASCDPVSCNHSSKTHVMRRWLRRLRKHIQPVTVILLTLIVALALGFIIFSEHVGNLKHPSAATKADAIIVLTGGKSRIETALELLEDKRGQRLLISGVHPATKTQALQRITKYDAELFSCCIDLDRSAMNTIGNATESAKWIREHGYKRIFVVTNNYHMPRSLLEMSRQIDNVELIPYPVINSDLKNSNWLRKGDTLRVLFTEYIKYIGAYLHINLGLSD